MSGAPGERGGRRRILRVAYDGTGYAGWQVQPDQPTIQGELQRALGELLGSPVTVHGAGRTDAGVHALGQVCHFDDPRGWPVERLQAALLGRLPPAVRVWQVVDVPPVFHARHGARSKTYVFQLRATAGGGGLAVLQRRLPPWCRHTHVAVPAELDLAAMRAAANRLLGRRDFTALSRTMPPERGTVRHLMALRLLPTRGGWHLFATADGFLYGMVRLLAGFLVEVGAGRRSPADVEALLAARDRSRAPPSLPPQGLYLWRVDYGPEGPGRAPLRGLLS